MASRFLQKPIPLELHNSLQSIYDGMTSMIPQWKLSGDWFDVCRCNIPCPCTFAQAPSDGECQGVLAYHINNGHYGDRPLDGERDNGRRL